MDLLFATTNSHKLQEIKAIIKEHNIISLVDLNDKTEVEESGETFRENAYLKAKYFYDKYKIPTFADDSGLIVHALGNEPGVRSARYAGEKATYLENNLKLLKKLENIEDRSAYFITVICYIDQKGMVHYFEGKVTGEIIAEFRGNEGFGYDPIFYLPKYGKTYAELGNEKNKISHRYLALDKFLQYLKGESNG